MHIHVLGAGISGLATAALLAHQGHQVTVLEKNPTPGGRARTWQSQGFTFDMGPSWYLMPHVYEHFFSIFQKKPSDYYQLIRLDPSYRIFLKDQVIDISPDLQVNLAIFDQLEANGSQKLQQYLQYAQQQFDLAEKSRTMLTSFDSPKDYLNKNFLLHASRLDVRRNFVTILNKYFQTESARNLAAYATIFLGADPRQLPAFFAMLSHIDYTQGTWYPLGGIGSLVQALYQLCLQQGVHFHFQTPALHLNIASHRITHVKTPQQTFPTELVISALDYAYTETALIDLSHQSYNQQYWQSRILTPTAFVVFLGLNRSLPQLTHHNAFLHHGWQSHFDQIFDHPSWPSQPAYYICAPSKSDPSVAPPNHENLFLTIPISTQLSDTPQSRQKYFNYFLKDFQARVGEDLKKSIITQRIYTKNDFISDYHAYQGTALGPAPTLSQAGFFAPHHQSAKVKNLFFTGQFTHPGSGMPAVLQSAQIVAGKIQSQYG